VVVVHLCQPNPGSVADAHSANAPVEALPPESAIIFARHTERSSTTAWLLKWHNYANYAEFRKNAVEIVVLIPPEGKGLQLRDVDLESRTLAVKRNSTKTDAGCRLIPLNNAAVWALGRLFERARLLKAINPEHYLFPASRCKHTKEGYTAGSDYYDPAKPMVSWRSGWRTLTRNAGLKGLRFHDLRHHSITKLAEAGVAEQTLMAIAGHVSKSMLEHYSHIRLKAKHVAVDAINTINPPPADASENENQTSPVVD